jgi:CHAT domain-containing protein
VIQNQLTRVGRYTPAVAGSLARFAALLNEQGRYRDAEAMARAAIDIHKVIGSAPGALSRVVARRQLGASLVLQSRWQEAQAEFDALRADLATDAETRELFQRGPAPYRAIALIKNGRAQDAVALLEPGLAMSVERLGTGHYEVAEQRGLLALALDGAGQRQRALAEYAEAAKVLLARAQEAGDEDGSASARAWRLALILEGYIKLLHDVREGLVPQRAGLDPAAEAFRVADAVRGQGTQRALSASAARTAANDPALAELIRREQDAKQQTAAYYATLLRMLGAPADQQLPQLVAQMRQRIQALERDQRALSTELARRFPAYANLIHPRPASVDEARGALREGEVLLSLLTTDEQTYVWAVPKSGPVLFHATPLGEKAVAEAVAVLRRALDVGHVTLDAVPDFDVTVAHRLYAALLQPVAGAWQDAHTLMVVANGALGQLPFSLLPTAAAAPGADSGGRFSRYQTVPWLLKQVAVAQLPAVNTLVTLRGMRAGAAQRTPFAGFGDPQFGPQLAVTPQSDQLALRMRSVALPGATAENWIPYSRLAPLPDTRDEILAIAKVLQADAGSAYLGAAASKQNVLGAELSKRRIIAFATHGLVPGDFPDLDQPALALSAPGGSAAEGLLTLGDILALKLDADWIVLSACNTAAGDGTGAEAISGLGRGFFYAGSRALLVTHWPVETGAARTLVTGLFERYAADTKLSRAEALRQASLATMAGTGRDGGGRPFSYAHPLFWAPYALIGDGGR